MTTKQIIERILLGDLFEYKRDIYYLVPRTYSDSDEIAYYLLYKSPTGQYVGLVDKMQIRNDYMTAGRDFLGTFIKGKVFFRDCTIFAKRPQAGGEQ